MARPLTHSLPSDTLAAAIRRHFGLSQDELARYLAVTRMLVSHLETGQRQTSPALRARLDYLAVLLPPPTGHGLAAPAFEAAAVPASPALPVLPATEGELAVEPLQYRLLQVNAQASRLRWELHRATKGAVLQRRREWGLAQLQAALPPAGMTDAIELAHINRWLTVLAADIDAARATPGTRAAQALLVLRIQSLETEANTLTQLLEKYSTME